MVLTIARPAATQWWLSCSRSPLHLWIQGNSVRPRSVAGATLVRCGLLILEVKFHMDTESTNSRKVQIPVMRQSMIQEVNWSGNHAWILRQSLITSSTSLVSQTLSTIPNPSTSKSPPNAKMSKGAPYTVPLASSKLYRGVYISQSVNNHRYNPSTRLTSSFKCRSFCLSAPIINQRFCCHLFGLVALSLPISR